MCDYPTGAKFEFDVGTSCIGWSGRPWQPWERTGVKGSYSSYSTVLGQLEGLGSARVSIKPEPDRWATALPRPADHAITFNRRTFHKSICRLLPVPSNLVTIILGHFLPILETDKPTAILLVLTLSNYFCQLQIYCTLVIVGLGIGEAHFGRYYA